MSQIHHYISFSSLGLYCYVLHKSNTIILLIKYQNMLLDQNGVHAPLWHVWLWWFLCTCRMRKSNQDPRRGRKLFPWMMTVIEHSMKIQRTHLEVEVVSTYHSAQSRRQVKMISSEKFGVIERREPFYYEVFHFTRMWTTFLSVVAKENLW